MKIDIFPHILPKKYYDAIQRETGLGHFILHKAFPTLFDLDIRFRIMDKFDGLVQILNIATPPVENLGDPKRALYLARLANDEMAELVLKYPDRFPSAIACLPMNNMNAALDEVDRAVKDLKFRGVQIFTPTNDKPLDSPEFFPLYEKMCQYNLPILIHPVREPDYPDYRSEKASKYGICSMLGWVYETSTAMVRIVLSGILEKYPDLKLITHHCGAMIPYLARRITQFSARHTENLSSPTLEYFKKFYADTALYGHTSGLMCGYEFFGAQHLLFGTDMPFDSQLGFQHTRETIESIEQMDISDSAKREIFESNAIKILRLPI